MKHTWKTSKITPNAQQTAIVRAYVNNGFLMPDEQPLKDCILLRNPDNGNEFYVNVKGVTFKTKEQWDKR